jgi:hypothetical protein
MDGFGRALAFALMPAAGNRAGGLLTGLVDLMRSMTDSPLNALWMAGRAEFFSMMTVMAGMGAVMAYVTPTVVGQQPPAGTPAFWRSTRLTGSTCWVHRSATGCVPVGSGPRHRCLVSLVRLAPHAVDRQ